MSTSRRTRTMAQCRSRDTKWRTAISSSGRLSTTTRRSRRLVCRIQGFHPMTGSATTSRWSKTATGRTVHRRWGIWVQRQPTRMVHRTVTSRLRPQCTPRVSCRRRRRRRVVYRAVRRWNRHNRCHTICTLSSTWCSTACRRISSTSCTRWTICSTRHKCRRCTSSRCTRSSPLLSSLRLTPMHRCQVHYTPG